MRRCSFSSPVKISRRSPRDADGRLARRQVPAQRDGAPADGREPRPRRAPGQPLHGRREARPLAAPAAGEEDADLAVDAARGDGVARRGRGQDRAAARVVAAAENAHARPRRRGEGPSAGERVDGLVAGDALDDGARRGVGDGHGARRRRRDASAAERERADVARDAGAVGGEAAPLGAAVVQEHDVAALQARGDELAVRRRGRRARAEAPPLRARARVERDDAAAVAQHDERDAPRGHDGLARAVEAPGRRDGRRRRRLEGRVGKPRAGRAPR